MLLPREAPVAAGAFPLSANAVRGQRLLLLENTHRHHPLNHQPILLFLCSASLLLVSGYEEKQTHGARNGERAKNGTTSPLPLRTRKFVLAITVKDACQGETSFQWHKTNQNAPKGVKQKQGIRCRARSNSSRWAAGRSNRRIGRNSWLDRPSRLRGH